MRSAALLSLVLLAAVPLAASEEPPTLTLGTVEHLRSQVLGEERRLNVFLPPGYAGSAERYGVLYLLDGSAHEDYFHITSLVDFLATYGVMPPVIVVGISNVDRKRDFTPPSADPEDRAAVPTSGGAGKFIDFLARELLPWVEAHYRTGEPRLVVGQSLGGLLATQVLLDRPELFTHYVIVSPSLWWDHQALLQGAAPKLAAHPTPGRSVYLSVGDEGEAMRAADERLAGLLRASGWPGLGVTFDVLSEETRATSLHLSVYRAMVRFFKAQG